MALESNADEIAVLQDEKKSETEPEAVASSSSKDQHDDKEDSHTADEGKSESKEEEKQAEKPKTVDWPLRDIKEPHANDVLYGRGGGTNHHPGNKRYRKMVEDRKLDYVNSKRLDKPLVALQIIREWRAQDPPGRFLKIDERTGLWHDVGDKKAREKTSQALREKAPLIRKQQEDERIANHQEETGEADDSEKVSKSTRFAEGTNTEGNSVTKAVLARDHSLGREYLEADEAVTLDGFSWQDPFQSNKNVSMQHERVSSQSGPPPPPPPVQPYHPAARAGSHSSIGMPPEQGHYRYNSHGSVGPPPPPPPGQYHDDRHVRYASHGRYESWGSLPPGPAPPMPPGGYMHQGSIQHSGSWGQYDPSTQRENSLGQFPLAHASVSQPAVYSTFDGRAGSGHWGPGPIHQSPPPPSPRSYGPMDYQYSGGPPPPSTPAYPPPPPPAREYSPVSPRGSAGPPSPQYTVDPAVASQWSGQGQAEIVKTMSGEEYDQKYRSQAANRSPRQGKSEMPKPDVVKRATSHQNETQETKPGLCGPSVKRAALNRDSSRASNRLKELCFPGQFKNGNFDTVKEMNELSEDMDRHTLVSPKQSFGEDDRNVSPTQSGLERKSISDEQRTSTLDVIAMDLMVKPVPLTSTTRSSTIEALALDLDDDPLIRPEQISRSTTMEAVFAELREGLPKPGALSSDDRMTTKDFLDMVNEPIPDDEPELYSGKRQMV